MSPSPPLMPEQGGQGTVIFHGHVRSSSVPWFHIRGCSTRLVLARSTCGRPIYRWLTMQMITRTAREKGVLTISKSTKWKHRIPVVGRQSGKATRQTLGNTFSTPRTTSILNMENDLYLQNYALFPQEQERRDAEVRMQMESLRVLQVHSQVHAPKPYNGVSLSSFTRTGL